MKIEKAIGYQVGTAFFPTLFEAQIEALGKLLCSDGGTEPSISKIVSNASEVIAILNPPKELRSRATRKDKGTKRPGKVRIQTKEPEPVQ